MKKIITIVLLTIMSIALIGLGWFLEVYYYHFRFVADGIDNNISWIFGAALTVLLSALFLKFIFKSFLITIGRVVLIAVSVFCTVSGQNYSYNQANNANSTNTALEENITVLYHKYNNQVKELTAKIAEKEKLLPSDITKRTMLNTNGVQPLLNEIEQLEDRKEKAQDKRDSFLLSKTSSEKTDIKNKTAYELLAEDLGLHSPTLLKLITQTLLSLFISLMAPIGVTILTTVYKTDPPKQKKVQEPVKKNSKTEIITLYARSRYRNEQKPATLKGRGEVTAETGISNPNFHKLSNMAKDLNLIRVNGNMTLPNVPLDNFIEMMLNKQPFQHNGLKVVTANS